MSGPWCPTRSDSRTRPRARPYESASYARSNVPRTSNRWAVANVFLKILEEPPGSATLVLTAPSPSSLLPTIVSRCMQFHFAPLPLSEVEQIVRSHTERKPSEIKLAAQLSEGSPGLAIELNLEEAVEKRR